MIAHCDSEDEDAWTLSLKNPQYVVREIRVGVVRRAPRSAETFDTEKGLEAERWKGEVTVEKVAIEGVYRCIVIVFPVITESSFMCLTFDTKQLSK